MTLRSPDAASMRLNFPCRMKTEGDMHNSEKIVYKVRCVGGTTKKEIEGTSGVPLGGWQSFAATTAQSQFLHFLAICVELGLELRCLDVLGAYLNAEAPRDHMYYEPPVCITPPDPNKPYLRAKKALYGYAESGRAWYLHWNKILKDIGFKACDRNSTWLTRTTSDGVAMVGTVVDDCVFGVSSGVLWSGFSPRSGSTSVSRPGLSRCSSGSRASTRRTWAGSS